MCDYFHQQTMENYQGDLADIIRAGGGPISGTLGSSTTTSSSFGDPLLPTTDSWQFLHSDSINFPSDDFGHPFSSLRDDPLLLQDLDMSAAGSSFFTSSNGIENTGGLFGQKINNIDHQEIKRNNNFSRMLQISPNNNAKLSVDSPMTSASPRLLKPPPPTLISANDHMISVNSSKGTSCLIENTGVQISSPRNTGIKRRKSQAKKVVCIPAPAPANSRPTGEIVPSDLWAWRKYGQKPIKGSPYPRGYYRCSSSKGCSARKQVERSRTDPNMLVITYTSEHNHPWPTQRNALAGSTRTQPTKNINSPATSKNSPQKAPLSSLKEEEKESINIDNNVSSSIDVTAISSSTNVKEEEMEEKEITEMEGGDQFSDGFPPLESYKPALPDSNNSDQDFFADLGEIGGDDPLSLLFTQGFSGDEGRESSKALDPFIFYDWTVGNSNSNSNSNNTTSSFGDQAKRGL